MKLDTVAKLPGMFQRGGVWQLRVMVPLDLQPAYAGRSKVIQSLDTTDWREASRKGAQLRALKLEEFEDKRRSLNPQPVAQITPELGATLGARIRARLLQWDDNLRDDPQRAQLWLSFVEAFSPARLSGLRIGPAEPLKVPTRAELAALAERSPFDGLTPAQLHKLAEVNRDADEAAGVQLAARRLSAVLPLADSEARKLGLLVDWRTPEARPVLLECLRAYRAAWAGVVQRDGGHDVVTPAAPAKPPAPAAPPMRLRDVFDRWKDVKKRSADSLNACARSLALFEEQSGDPPVQQITRAQGDAFRAWLQTKGTSSKTARDRLTWVKSLLVYACRDLELIPRQPWEGLDIEHRTENPRRPWTDAQLRAFFSLPLFAEHKLPTAWKAGGAAAYWVPLLGLYTGARIGELCQLRVVDIEQDKDGAVIRITEEAEGATVKTDAGLRVVPVHSELVRLGFLDYVETMRKAGEVSLWPKLGHRKGKPGAYFSGWFSEARKQVTEGGPVPDFHSLRHTVRTALMEADLDGDVIDRIIGHETRGAGKRYAHPTKILRRAVEALRFPVELQPGKW